MKKILIVDDEPNIVELLRLEFVENGYEVITASGGKECLGKVCSENPDLVILDLKLPDLSGSEVAQALENDPRYKDLPIIFLTGLLSKDDEKKTGNQIARHVIFAKPFSVLKIAEKVREILAARDRQSPRGPAIQGTPN